MVFNFAYATVVASFRQQFLFLVSATSIDEHSSLQISPPLDWKPLALEWSVVLVGGLGIAVVTDAYQQATT